jgi:general secretion pathway protein A
LLEQQLIAAGTATNGEQAMSTLFELWGIGYDPAAGNACSQAEQQGFSCYFSRSTWSGLRQLDRPVALTLTDSSGNTHQLALVALQDETADLAIGEKVLTYSLDDLSELWFGQFLLVWNPPNGKPDAIRLGMRDENVRWLRQTLAAVDPDSSPDNLDSDYFDDDLQREVMDFQRRHRLPVDGLVGSQTQIVLNSLLGLDDTPRLVADR